MFLLILNENQIAVAKAIKYVGDLFKNEIEITEEQYDQMNEFPIILIVDNGIVTSWKKTILPIEEQLISTPSIEDRVTAMEEVLLNLL